jgi:hypothetical protein
MNQELIRLIESNAIQIHGDVEYFAELVAAAEREACAKVCADLYCKEPEPGDARDCYDAIRARGQG